jgi:DNA adenine methylase
MTAVTSPALRYHGAKFRLAPWVLQHFPAHHRYVESFGGAAGVLLRKPRTYAEIYNDIDEEIVNFFRVLQCAEKRAALIEKISLTPYARSEFLLAFEQADDDVERARRTAIRASMGFSSAGATKGSTGFRTDTRRSYGTAQHIWAAYPESIAAVGDRFAGVLVENRPAIEVMLAHDGVDTLHFVDPPYLFETRSARVGTGRFYRHELSDQQHDELISALRSLEGMVVLCGYPSKRYDAGLQGWSRSVTRARISAGRGTGLRVEALWMNPACVDALGRTPNRNAQLFEAQA